MTDAKAEAEQLHAELVAEHGSIDEAIRQAKLADQQHHQDMQEGVDDDGDADQPDA